MNNKRTREWQNPLLLDEMEDDTHSNNNDSSGGGKTLLEEEVSVRDLLLMKHSNSNPFFYGENKDAKSDFTEAHAPVLRTDRSLALLENEKRGDVFRQQELKTNARSTITVRFERRVCEFSRPRPVG